MATTSRPDIFAVGQISRYCANYTSTHWNAVIRIFSYLKGTTNLRLRYGGKELPLTIVYCGAEYKGDLDDRRSTSGYIFFCNGGPVCWESRKQSITAQSTTESPNIYLRTKQKKEGACFCQVVLDITGVNIMPLIIKYGNNAAIAAAHRQGRTKHIQIKINLIRENIRTGKIKMECVASEDQLADIFTKPLRSPAFQEMRKRIGLNQVSA